MDIVTTGKRAPENEHERGAAYCIYGRQECGAASDEPGQSPWVCTAAANHPEPEHVAGDGQGNVLATWRRG